MRRSSGSGFGFMFGIILFCIAVALFVKYTQTAIPHTYPTPYVNFFWGLVHGTLILPTLICSFFMERVTIYQAPNIGNWYNIGYFLGAGGIIFGGAYSV